MLSECTWQAKRGIRTEDWKYIHCYDPGIYPRSEDELYDLRTDPDEQRNIALERPDVAAEFRSELNAWLRSNLDGRADPMLEVIRHGLPAVTRLRGVIEEDRDLGTLGAPPAPCAAPLDHLDPFSGVGITEMSQTKQRVRARD